MRKKWKHSILAKFTVLAMIIIGILLGVLVGTRSYIKKTLKQNTIDANQALAEQVEERVTEYKEHLNHVATTLAYSPTVYTYFHQDRVNRVISREDMNAVFLNTVLLEEDILRIYLYDADDQLIANMGDLITDVKIDVFLKDEHEGVSYSNIHYWDKTNIPYYIVVFPVYDLQDMEYGTMIGTCLLLLKTDSLYGFLENAKVTEHTEYYLIDENDYIISDNQNHVMQKMMEEHKHSNGMYYVENHPLPIQNWTLVTRIPMKELNGGSDFSTVILIITYISTFLMILTLVYYCYRDIILPLKAVEGFIDEAVYKSNLRMQTDRIDEIGSLTANLNHLLDEKEYMSREIQESQKKMYEADLLQKQTQILAYQNQINPHFLYNTLGCVRSIALYYEVKEIAEIVSSLSDIFRFAVKGDNIVSVRDEICHVTEYAKIIGYRFNHKINIDIHAEEQIQEKKVIKLLFQPLVENAIFHGLERKIGGGSVQVFVTAEDRNRMSIVVSDNGSGMSRERLEEVRKRLETAEPEKGIGLSNIYQRLKLHYGNELLFSIESELDVGTKIVINVPDEIPEEKENVQSCTGR